MTTDAVGTDGQVTGDQVKGATAREVLEYVAKNIVDDPDAVVIDVEEGRRGDVRLSLRVSPDDMGKVIGRRGRVAQAIRAVVRAAGAREGVEVIVDIVD
ncbi:MAG: KH domain-containing protein [Acidimicrobiales bacterium]